MLRLQGRMTGEVNNIKYQQITKIPPYLNNKDVENIIKTETTWETCISTFIQLAERKS